jgi:hypothetical protein
MKIRKLDGKKKEIKPRRPGRCTQMPRLGKTKIKESCAEREIGECKIKKEKRKGKEEKRERGKGKGKKSEL